MQKANCILKIRFNNDKLTPQSDRKYQHTRLSYDRNKMGH